jgi:hypothetical protein
MTEIEFQIVSLPLESDTPSILIWEGTPKYKVGTRYNLMVVYKPRPIQPKLVAG